MGQPTCYMAHLLDENLLQRASLAGDTTAAVAFDAIDFWARMDSNDADVSVSWLPTAQHAMAGKWGKGEQWL